MRRLLSAGAIAAAILVSTASAAAPPGSDGAFNFRGGGFFPKGSSDFWEEQEQDFTLDHSDFNTLIGGVGYTASINNYIEFDVNADFWAASSRSTDRDFVDQFGNVIIHDTRLFVAPVTVGFRVLPAGRYARRGAEGQHYVRRPVPYIGGGVGLAYWSYEEEGDFVFPDSSVPGGVSIAYDRVKDTGLEFETHVNAGIEFPVSPAWSVTFEVRQSWAEAHLGAGFPSTALTFNDPRHLDIGGTSVFVGAAMRF